MEARLLTPADVAQRCQISTKSVLRAIHRGELRASRLGEHAAFRIRECDVDAWIEHTVVVTPGPTPVAVVPSRAPTNAGCGSPPTWDAMAAPPPDRRPEKGSVSSVAP